MNTGLQHRRHKHPGFLFNLEPFTEEISVLHLTLFHLSDAPLIDILWKVLEQVFQRVYVHYFLSLCLFLFGVGVTTSAVESSSCFVC